MPLKRCSDSGKSGWKWGESGECYSGPGGKEKAIKQGVAIEGPEKFKRMASTLEEPIGESEISSVASQMYQEGYSNKYIVAMVAILRADYRAGYPPNCKEGYVEKNGKCVLSDKGANASKMKRSQINNLPDSDFAYIEPGGKKDSEGKTVPRSLRHLPIPDAAHVRNALSRLSQTDISEKAKKVALRKIKRKAKELGVSVSDK